MIKANYMKRALVFLAAVACMVSMPIHSEANPPQSRKQLVSALTTLDSNIVGYFPRWSLCEYDLQIQIEQVFILHGFPADSLDVNDIVVTAAPKSIDDPYEPYQLLLVECGQCHMTASEIDSYMESLAGIVSGEIIFSGPYKGFINDYGERTYCFNEIPKDQPLTQYQHEVITDFLEPTNVNHAFTLSAFDQAVKVGESGFWLRSHIGNDAVGYHFWSAGEATASLRRPLYENTDPRTRKPIPHLIDVWIGGAYRLSTGLEDGTSGVFDWVKDRRLNAGPGGKFFAGLDFHAPMHPEAGLHVELNLPFAGLGTDGIDPGTYALFPVNDGRSREVLLVDRPFDVLSVAPILRGTGQITGFYHLWLDPAVPENYFRFDLGISYAEVREAAFFIDDERISQITTEGVQGLRTYKNKEFGDWVYAKVEYRSQAAFPFGISAQYSNQILLGRVYIPLFGRFFYLEGKYAQPLRSTRYFESDHFFMISPVLRLTI